MNNISERRFVCYKYLIISFLVITLIIPIKNSAYAATTDPPTPWINFNNTGSFDGQTGSGNIFPVLFGGNRFIDYMGSQDPTANTGTGDSAVDISSGCANYPDATLCNELANCNPLLNVSLDSCGPQTSGFWGFYDGGSVWDNTACSSSMCDDFIFFRLRLRGSPNDNDEAFKSSSWIILLDVNGDGFQDFLIEIEGSFGNGNNSPDRVNIIYNSENNNGQSCDDAVNPTNTCSQNCSPTTCQTIDTFVACNTDSGNTTECNNNSHTRSQIVSSVVAGDPSGSEYYIVKYLYVH